MIHVGSNETKQHTYNPGSLSVHQVPLIYYVSVILNLNLPLSLRVFHSLSLCLSLSLPLSSSFSSLLLSFFSLLSLFLSHSPAGASHALSLRECERTKREENRYRGDSLSLSLLPLLTLSPLCLSLSLSLSLSPEREKEREKEREGGREGGRER